MDQNSKKKYGPKFLVNVISMFTQKKKKIDAFPLILNSSKHYFCLYGFFFWLSLNAVPLHSSTKKAGSVGLKDPIIHNYIRGANSNYFPLIHS